MSKSYNPNREGWGVIGFICALTVAAWIVAYMVHKNTYLQPPDTPAASTAATH